MHCNYGKVFKLSSNNSEPFQVCKLLLDKNAFVNSKTKLGWTALHFAASKVTISFFALVKRKNETIVCGAGLHRSGRVPHQVRRLHRFAKEKLDGQIS